jgi:putative ABC transport system ATP-binding protein
MIKVSEAYKSSFEQFKQLLSPEKTFVKIIMINSTVISFLALVIPIAVQTIISKIVILKVVQPLIILSFIVLLVLAFSGVIQAIQIHIIEILRRRIFIRLMHVALKKFIHFEDEKFQEVDSGALSNRLIDILFMQTSMVSFFGEGMAFCIQYIFAILFLMFYHPYLFVLAIFMTFFFILSWRLFGLKGVKAGSPEADSRYAVFELLQEVAKSRHNFMSDKKESFLEHKLHEKCLNWTDKRQILFQQQFSQSVTLQIIQSLTYTLLLGVGGGLVLSQELSLGQLVAATLMITIILTSLSRLQTFYTSVYDFTTNLDKFAEFFNHPEEIIPPQVFEPTDASIEFRDVFQKPNVKLNFKLKSSHHHYIYIKSFYSSEQVINLILGFKKAEQGRVFIGSYDISEINLRKWRDDVVVISKNNHFRGTIRENIWPYTDNVSETTLKNALEKLGMLERIEKLPLQLETPLLPNGNPLSTSQLITLQFVTALLRKPKLIIIAHDFEIMSSFKRQKAFELIKNNEFESTILFFSQNLYPNVFSDFHMLGRDGIKTLADFDELKKVVQTGYGVSA